MIAHELRSPTCTNQRIHRNVIETRKDGTIELTKQKKSLQSIYRNVKKQESLVDDVLDVYKLDLGKIHSYQTRGH